MSKLDIAEQFDYKDDGNHLPFAKGVIVAAMMIAMGIGIGLVYCVSLFLEWSRTNNF